QRLICRISRRKSVTITMETPAQTLATVRLKKAAKNAKVEKTAIAPIGKIKSSAPAPMRFPRLRDLVARDSVRLERPNGSAILPGVAGMALRRGKAGWRPRSTSTGGPATLLESLVQLFFDHRHLGHHGRQRGKLPARKRQRRLRYTELGVSRDPHGAMKLITSAALI